MRSLQVADPSPGDVPWSGLAEHVPDGTAVVDVRGRFVHLNPAGATLCGAAEPDLVGRPAPFELAGGDQVAAVGLLDQGSGEQVCRWGSDSDDRREFTYRTRPLPRPRGLTVVAFRDLTAERHRQRMVSAIARTAVKLASEGSTIATLDALAQEVLQADALAGVQIITLDDSSQSLQIMGSAGFPRWPDFFDRLTQCRDNGASLKWMQALETREPVVVPHRWAAIRRDPAWAPLHEYLGELRWDWFASAPLMIRGRAAGIINAFFIPGHVVGRRSVEFLQAMAERASVALDYASLLQNERELARREERQRLARDLHDSIVQQVFSIGMQAKLMGVLGARSTVIPAENVRRIAEEINLLARTVLADLRAMVHELQPTATQLGLEEAVRALIESTTNRTGLGFSLRIGRGLDQIPPAMAEDLYRIVAEAVHNVVKHADASRVTLRLSIRDHRVMLSIGDNGRGFSGVNRGDASERSCGYGLTGMGERGARWGGTVHVRPRKGTGVMVRAVIPLPARSARASSGPDIQDHRPQGGSPGEREEH